MSLHHIEMWVHCRKSVLELFSKLGFHEKASRECLLGVQDVVSNGSVDFIITSPSLGQPSTNSEFVLPLESIHRGGINKVDTVYNVCLEVERVDEVTRRMCRHGGICLREPSVVEDRGGRVTYSIVGTEFGNIMHTLIDKKDYPEGFLPGFELKSPVKASGKVTGRADHVTYVCHPGQSQRIIDWYTNCLGIETFYFSNSGDQLEAEMVIKDNINIKLNAAKLNILSNKNALYLVLAEPLSQKSENHVNVFLNEHGGPGIEHVAFHTDNIFKTMEHLLAHQQLKFRKIPDQYYNSLPSIDNLFDWLSVEQLRTLGILIDVENNVILSENRVLLQAFTTNIFEEKTFFVEIIQRVGAKGFGAKNIINIMKAIESDLQKKPVHSPITNNSIA